LTNDVIKNEDLEYIWHPCSQMKDYETLPLIPIKQGKGVWLEDFDGNRYIDAVSSWWVNLFGHANPRINAAVKAQVDTLEHVIFAGFTHEPAVRLAKRLVALTPEGLTKLFFADNGSSAIEVAIKMSFHYFKNRGSLKPLVISLENSYHGETLGALSVGDVALYKETYKEILIRSVQVKSPALVSEDAALSDLEATLKRQAHEVCCMIIEPLIQCAGNMQMYSPSYITKAKALCEAYNVHLIADEIAVGFGRTGTLFACEQAGITPDFMCLSKGLTGGYLPLSVVLTSDDVYNAFYCDYSEGKSFLHSHSYTGNPIACAVANAVLDIFESDDVIENNRAKSAQMAKELERFKALENVENIRQCGMVAAFDISGYEPSERVGLNVYRYGLDNGVLLRPLGHTVYFMPPYTINEAEMKKMFDTAYEAVKRLVR